MAIFIDAGGLLSVLKRSLRYALQPTGRVQLSRLFLGIGIFSSTALLVSLVLIFTGHGPAQRFDSAGLAMAIDAKMAKLGVRPRKIELLSEKARAARDDIKQGKFSAAHQMVAAVLDSSHIQNWRFYPFEDFIADIVEVDDSAFENKLTEWVGENHDDAIALLIRAQYYYSTGWFIRGHGFPRQIQPGHFAAFQNYTVKALNDIDSAIRLDGGNPYDFGLKLRLLYGSGISQAMKSAFEDAISKYPSYYALYSIVLDALQPKWGGSPDVMYAFVDQFAGNAAEYSGLKLLYLDLYRGLLQATTLACAGYRVEKDKMGQCVAAGMGEIITPELEKHVLAALQLYDHSDKYQFTLAMGGILFSLLETWGGEVYSGAILQLAASSMHSNPRPEEEASGRNNYVIDEAVASSWYGKGFYDSALRKYQDALKDAENASFPSEEEKDLTIAGIYESIAYTYDRLNQYVDMIAYEKAAIALGGKTANEHLICYGYYQLKDYADGVRECAKTIDGESGHLQTHYWRGMAYFDSDDRSAALRDFTMVANSESDMRTWAALRMAMVYADWYDMQGMLNVLNKYTYLYDPDINSKDNVAVSYDNRCYAHMRLGHLRQALDDCNASLKYGSLPNAFRMQQELLERLKPKSADQKP